MMYAILLWAALGAADSQPALPSDKVAASVPAFTLSLDGGANLFNNGDGWGGGFNLSPGIDLNNGLVPELQFGLHMMTTTVATFPQGRVTSRLYFVPMYVGARYEMSRLLDTGALKPFVGLHLGPAVVRGTDANGWPITRAQFGFNMGAGFDYAVCHAFGLGASVWYDFVAHQSDADNAWLSLGLNARYHFGFDSATASP